MENENNDSELPHLENPKNSQSEQGETPSSIDLVSQANLAALRIEEANKVRAELLDREQKMYVARTLGGKAEVGQGKTEESDEEYAKKVMANELESKRS